MPLTLPIPIYEKISLRGALKKCVKPWVLLHKNVPDFCQIFPEHIVVCKILFPSVDTRDLRIHNLSGKLSSENDLFE